MTPEYRVDVGWADYALHGPGNQPAAVIEAKRLGTFVENNLTQAVNYCIQEGVAYAGVTDGNHWQMYRTFEPVPMADKRVLDIQISNKPSHELALQLLLLWRPNLASGQPVAAAEPLFEPVYPSVPETPFSVPTPHSYPSAPPPIEPGWVSLSSFNPTAGATSPASVRFADGSVREVKNWRTLVVETIKWLWSKHLLTQDNIPVQRAPTSKQYIVNIEPVHGTGTNFHHSVPIEGTPLFFDANVGVSAPDRARTLLKHCNINPDTVQLKVGQ